MDATPEEADPVDVDPPRYEKDPRQYRATYGIRYPTAETKFSTKQQLAHLKGLKGAKAVVNSTKIHWELSGASVETVVFRECNFHTGHGQVASTVSSLTFVNCDFDRCLLGFVHFRRTTFRRCTFTRCEMSRTEFEDCTFEECSFRECTPWEAVFQRTLIDPMAFLDGFRVPPEHLQELSTDKREEIDQRYTRLSVGLAEQILRSNEERRNALYCDRALFRSRKAAIAWRCAQLKSKTGRHRLWELLSLWSAKAYLHLTKGGTSLRRLFGVAAVVCFAMSVVFMSGLFDLTVRTISAKSLSFAESASAAAALFLAFGYENVGATGGPANVLITVIPIVGLGWSAVVLAVVVRRAYR